MNAKQAIFDELGDLFSATPQENNIGSSEESNADDDIVLLTEAEEGMEAVNEYESDADSGSTAEIGDDGDAVGGTNPPDLFDSIYATAAFQQDNGADTSKEWSDSELTDEERDACIEAATEAITETKMSPEELDWGLNFIQRMYDEKNAKIRARINSIDWASAKARWEQEDAEEAAREQEERDRYLQA